MFDGKHPLAHKDYGDPILDASKIFRWCYTDTSQAPCAYCYLYSNSTGTVGLWINDGRLEIEGDCLCIGQVYEALTAEEKILFAEEIDNLFELFGA